MSVRKSSEPSRLLPANPIGPTPIFSSPGRALARSPAPQAGVLLCPTPTYLGGRGASVLFLLAELSIRVLNRSSRCQLIVESISQRNPLLQQQVIFERNSRAILLKGKRLVDVAGIEPAAPCLQSRCSPS
jgi:hypothetical protein